jgi:hypothetical protein
MQTAVQFTKATGFAQATRQQNARQQVVVKATAYDAELIETAVRTLAYLSK